MISTTTTSWRTVRNGLKKGFRLVHPLGVAGILLLVLMAAATFKSWTAGSGLVAVLVDGKQVAVAVSQEMVEEVLAELVASLDQDGSLHFSQTISYQRIREGEPLSAGELRAVLAGILSFTTEAWAIVIDGQPRLYLGDEQQARTAVERFQSAYLPKGEGLQITQAGLQEVVEYNKVEVEPQRILDLEAAIKYLASGQEEIQQYKVKKGESLWTIARDHKITVEELQAANPDLKGDKLKIGQMLNLVKAQPLLHMVVTYEQTVTEPIPYSTRVHQDANLWRGQERVQQRGVEGKRQVDYRVVTVNGAVSERQVLQEKILREPVPRVVTRGTRMMVASRDGGSGELGWPLRGRISSPFGFRGREFHTGVDIAGDMGDPVYAAEGGTVSFTDWRGNYGRLLIIDHGNGLETRYAHLSAFKVKLGDRVERGDVIGTVGNTGRSTGPHLHFEVLQNGNFQNPLYYLR